MRYNVAQQVPTLCEVLGAELACSELLPAFVRLLRDAEAEVRAAASSNIAAVCRLLPVEQVGGVAGGRPAGRLSVTGETACQGERGTTHAKMSPLVCSLGCFFVGPLASRCNKGTPCCLPASTAPGSPAQANDCGPRLQVVGSILPCVRELASDASQYVRSALAGVVMELAPMLGKVRTSVGGVGVDGWVVKVFTG